MRTNKVQTILIGIAVMLIAGHVNAQERMSDVSMTLVADKAEYLPGEAVAIEIRLRNDGMNAHGISNAAPKLLLSYGNGPFRRYIGPGESVVDPVSRIVTDIGPSETSILRSTVLYHRKKSAEHLSELYAREVREAELDDFFAVNRPGTYRLKAVFYDQAGKLEIESEPIEIRVVEPNGSDASVWESLKNDRAAAWFLHMAGMKETAADLAANPFLERMRHLTTVYPTSVHAIRFSKRQ